MLMHLSFAIVKPTNKTSKKIPDYYCNLKATLRTRKPILKANVKAHYTQLHYYLLSSIKRTHNINLPFVQHKFSALFFG